MTCPICKTKLEIIYILDFEEEVFRMGCENGHKFNYYAIQNKLVLTRETMLDNF